MKDDSISRQAALNCVYGTSPNKIKGRIAELPSAQPDKWDDTVYRKAVEMLLAHFVPEERYAEAVDGLRGLPSAQLAQDLPKGCTDTISRAAVLDLIEQSCCDLEYDCDNVALRKEVEALPPAQQWIPCTPETMPKEDGEYLCTVYRAIPPYHMFHPEENVYVKTVEVKEYRASSGFPSSVKAWQPKPIPWEGGQDDE